MCLRGVCFVARGPFPRSFCAGRCVLRRVRFGSAARLPRRVRPAGAFVRPGGRFVRPVVAFGVARRLRRIRYPRRRGIDPRDTAPVRAAVGWRLLRWRAGGQRRRGGGAGGLPRRVCSAFVGCVWWRCSRRLFALVADRWRSCAAVVVRRSCTVVSSAYVTRPGATFDLRTGAPTSRSRSALRLR